MGMISWSDELFQVHHADETVSLLPKEYALFQYLFTWKNRTFSREDLLDRVWPLEDPTDRTVDDHIYRLRRKLQKWSHLFTIDTVRGVGYRLSWKQHQPPKPSALNRDFSDSIRNLMETYHGMGMGAAMQTLSTHQEVLGFSMDPFYDMYLHFIRGDFVWFIETTSFPLPEKLFYLFHIYYMAETDPRKTVRVFKHVESHQDQMPTSFRDELQIAAVGLYAMAGLLAEAEQQLVKARQIVNGMNSESFTLFLNAEQTMLALLSNRLDEAEEIIRRSAEKLQMVPMQRELGSFTISRGVCMYLRGERTKARQLVDEGIEIIRATKFMPHLIYAVHSVQFFLQTFECDDEWLRKYKKVWTELTSEFKFEELKKSILSIIS
ncbi:winged helix-turn-helix domain-containing protein [Brevibacillus choshinensis]|uniref:winged helix-turn-helix domain-containing protein n=1 Tax=Brevibacillus choshinensis TaxID=54911 RepID=UPI002E1A279D|nr:winged helix-turn-helix domain-containing protein [Brevibacillus choshinensis]